MVEVLCIGVSMHASPQQGSLDSQSSGGLEESSTSSSATEQERRFAVGSRRSKQPFGKASRKRATTAAFDVAASRCLRVAYRREPRFSDEPATRKFGR